MRLESRARWGLILLLALVLRATHLEQASQQPDFSHPAVDALTHDYWARGLVSGDWTPPQGAPDPAIPKTPFFRPPGYPYFLAATYQLGGSSYWAPRIAQLLLGLLSIFVWYRIGRRWIGNTAGYVVALGMASYWGFIYFETELQAPTLLIALMGLGLWLIGASAEQQKWRYAALAGVVMGLGILVRPNVLLVAFWFAVWLLATSAAGARKKSIGLALLFLTTALAVTTVATLRNHRVSGEWVWISSNAGINLYIGNNEAATGTVFDEIPGLGSFATCFDYPQVKTNLETQLGKKLSYAETSDYFRARARRFIFENPGLFLASLLQKAKLFWGPVEIGHNKELHYERQRSPLLRYLPGWLLVLSFSTLGLGFWWGVSTGRLEAGKERAGTFLLLAAGCVVAYLLSILPFFVSGRYRLPVVPFLLIFAGFAIQSMWTLHRSRKHSTLLWSVLLLVSLYTVLRLMPAQFQPDESHYYYMRGVAYLEQNNLEEAENAFARAASIAPSHFKALHNQGTVLARQGKLREAIEVLKKAAAIRPDQGDIATNIGAAYVRLRQHEAAVPYFEAALRLEPDRLEYRRNLAWTYVESDRMREAIQECSRVLEQEPRDSAMLFARGRAALALGDAASASIDFEAAFAARQEPAFVNNMAWTLATHPVARNPDLALQLARWAQENDSSNDPSYLDTWAAAAAAAGDFELAVRKAKEAILGATALKRDTRKMRSRLALYEESRAYVEEHR